MSVVAEMTKEQIKESFAVKNAVKKVFANPSETTISEINRAIDFWEPVGTDIAFRQNLVRLLQIGKVYDQQEWIEACLVTWW